MSNRIAYSSFLCVSWLRQDSSKRDDIQDEEEEEDYGSGVSFYQEDEDGDRLQIDVKERGVEKEE